MNERHASTKWTRRAGACSFMLCLAIAAASPAQQSAQPATPNPPSNTPSPGQARGNQSSKAATHITPEQAKQHFELVDELLKFSSG